MSKGSTTGITDIIATADITLTEDSLKSHLVVIMK